MRKGKDYIMRCLERNKRTFWYCLYTDREAIVDEYGNETSEYRPIYSKPVEMEANISPATGMSNTEQFGNLDSYDKVIVTDDLSCPIDENTVLFIDKEPEYTEVDSHTVDEGDALYADDEVTPVSYSVPAYDYVVKRVAKSLNVVSIAVSKVKVS